MTGGCRGHLLPLGLALAILPSVGRTAEPVERLQVQKTILIDNNTLEWNNGSFDHHRIVTFGSFQYVAYWNGGGFLKLSRRDLRTDHVETLLFPDRLRNLADNHMTITAGISSGDGRLHLTYGHHSNPLKYRQSVAHFLSDPPERLSLECFSEPMGLVASDPAHETRVTYPMFFEGADESLYLVYRWGSTGKANTLLHRYDAVANTWERLGMLFSGADGASQRSSSYHQVPVCDSHGRFHLTWTWSLPEIHYAYSDDGGISWKNNQGTRVADLSASDPIDRRDDTSVLKAPGWVLWQGNLALDSDGQPHLATVANPADSKLGNHYAHYWRTEDGRWHTRFIDDEHVVLRTKGKGGHLQRPDLLFDVQGNLHVYYTVSGQLYAAVSSRAAGWKDWQVYKISDGPITKEDGLNHDRLRWRQDDVLSLACTQKMEEGFRFVIEDYSLLAGKPPTPFTIEVRPMFPLPPAPAGVEALRVKWNRGGLGAEFYDVWRKAAGEKGFTLLAEDFGRRSMRIEYVDLNVEPGQTYTYRVFARNGDGYVFAEAAGRLDIWRASLARGATVTASSSDARFPPEHTVDGKATSCWISGEAPSRDRPQWLKLDLGRLCEVSTLLMTPRLGRAFYGYTGPRDIAWQVEDGGAGWRDVGGALTATPDERSVLRLDPPVMTRRIRLLILSSYDPRNTGVAELAVHD